MVLLGPGVMDDTKANNMKAEINSGESGITTSGWQGLMIYTLTDCLLHLALQLSCISTEHFVGLYCFEYMHFTWHSHSGG